MSSVEWYRTLSIDQKMALKELTEAICGMKWEDFSILFTPRQRLDIIHTKLHIEGIIR